MKIEVDDKIEAELKKAFEEGPTFDSSDFQTAKFNVMNHAGAARSYRQVLLELNKVYGALKKAEIAVRKTNAEIRVLEKNKLREEDLDKQEIIECEILDKTLDLDVQEKLVKDAGYRLNQLYAGFSNMKKYTREEFENEEPSYWRDRLILQANLQVLSSNTIDPGLAQSLLQIGLDPLKIQASASLVKDLRIGSEIEKLKLELKEKEGNK